MITDKKLKIRNATPSDVADILTMIKELAAYEKLSDEVVATEGRIRQSLFGEHPVAECILAEYDGALAGFALYFHNFSTFLGLPGIYLEDLYVRKHLRGKGIGLALLQFLAKLAKVRGCGRLEWSVLDWNEPSINFYKHLGATAMDEWTVYRLTGDALDNLAMR